MTLNPPLRVHNTDVIGISPETLSIDIIVYIVGDPKTLTKNEALLQVDRETQKACDYLAFEGFVPMNGQTWRIRKVGVLQPHV